MHLIRSIILLPLLVAAIVAEAQTVTAGFGDGVTVVSADSTLSLSFSTRIQSLIVAEHAVADDAEIKTGVFIRRFRLKFDGFAHTPALTYKIELALSNNDNGQVVHQGNNAANVVLDAYVQYEFLKNTQIRFGQFKLPGNRERVISSQQLQFVDRSLVNSRYNLDRDIGLMLRHKLKLGKVLFQEMFAVAAGQGRNMVIEDDQGLSYTGRIEMLPFGAFTHGGDYFGSDLEREKEPKLSIGGGYSFNDEASRTRGELGSFVAASRDLSTAFADLMFKYRGFSVMSEYMIKMTDSPILADTSNFFVTGAGFVAQGGYLFKNDLELALRYTTIRPDDDLFHSRSADLETEYTLGVSKYFNGHNLKIQSDISYSTLNTFAGVDRDPGMVYRFQVELAL